MNKIKTKKKEMKNNHYILSVGYCAMQSLLRYYTPVAYSSGTYGWACDYYDINGIVISTGYSPINNNNMKSDYSIIREYEKKAQSLDMIEKEALLIELLEKLRIKED